MMNFYLKKNNGITLTTMILTILVLIIISTVLVFNVSSNISIRSLNNMYNDIRLLEEKIAIYYSKENELPILDSKLTYNEEIIDNYIQERNPNDNDVYYIIDLGKLDNLTLSFGRDYDRYNSSTDQINNRDVYVINEKSHMIYYIKGVSIKDKNSSGEPEYKHYYSLPIDKDTQEMNNYSGAFITEWLITQKNTTIQLPIDGIYDISVDFGDGTLLKPIRNTEENTHIYTDEGSYKIRITGKCDIWDTSLETGPDVDPSTNYITKIWNWGELEFKEIRFSDCTKLTGKLPIPSSYSFEKLTTAENMFSNCTSLTGPLPKDLFGDVEIDENFTFKNTFYNCISLAGDPLEVWNKIDSENVIGCYYNCTDLKGYEQMQEKYKLSKEEQEDLN